MNSASGRTAGKRSQRPPSWGGVLALALVMWSGCIGVPLCGGVGQLFQDLLHGPTPGAELTATAGLTNVPIPTSTSGPTLTPAARETVTPTGTPTPTAVPSLPSAHTPTALPSPTPTSTRTSLPTPTLAPVICSGLDGLSDLSIAPGQRFECAISETELTDRVRSVPDIPCSEVQITLDEGQIKLVCRLGIKLWAAGVARAEGCRLVLEITGGTPGFAGIVQDMIDAQMATVPQDAICVERVTVGRGQIEAAGYGR